MGLKRKILSYLIKRNEPISFDYFIDYRTGETQVFFVFKRGEDFSFKGFRYHLMEILFDRMCFLKIKSLREVLDRLEESDFLERFKTTYEIRYLLNFSSEASNVLESSALLRLPKDPLLKKKHDSIRSVFFDLINSVFNLSPYRIKKFFRKKYFISRSLEREKGRIRDYKIRKVFYEKEIYEFLDLNYKKISSWIWTEKKKDDVVFFDIRSSKTNNSYVLEDVVSEWLEFYLKTNIDKSKIKFKNSYY